MKAFLRAHWGLVALLVLLLLWAIGAPLAADKLLDPPVDQPLGLSPGGRVRETFRIFIEQRYELHLDFDRAGDESDELLTLIGGAGYRGTQPIQPGVHIPLRWSLREAGSGAPIAGADADTLGAMGWSMARVERDVAEFRLSPGAYSFEAEVLRDVPELAKLKCHLVVSLHHEVMKGYGITVGTVLLVPAYFVVGPAAVATAVILLALAIRDRRRARSLRDG